MAGLRIRQTAFLAVVSLCLLPLCGCGSKVVVGRSLADYGVAKEEQLQVEEAVPPTAAAPAAAEQKAVPAVPEKKAPQAKPEQKMKPASEAVPAPAEKPSATAETEGLATGALPTEAGTQVAPQPASPAILPSPAEKPPATAEVARPAAGAQSTEAGTEVAPQPASPPILPQSSRREAMPDEGPAPYVLDLSFGGFGLSQGLFDTPVAVAVDDDENIYVVDQGNFRIQKFDRFGQFEFTWGRQGLGDGEYEVKETGGVKSLRMTGIFEFNKPIGMLLDTDEARDLIRITVVDSLNHRIQRFLLTRTDGEPFPDEVFVRLPEGGTPVLDDELKERYSLERISVILDPVYIQKADRTFLTPLTWGGLGFSQGLLNAPGYISKDSSGMLFVTDSGNARVEGFYSTPLNPSTDASFFREFGNSLDKDYGAGRLKQPSAIVFDNTGYGSFIVVDDKPDGGQVLQRFDREGDFKGVFAETGGKPGQLRQPVSMAVSPFDNTVFITDRGHRKVMVYNSKGEFLFSFGGEELADPRGVAVLRNNYVYVTDAAKNMVYRYIPR